MDKSIKKGDLLRMLFPTLKVHTETTLEDKLKKVLEECLELLTATDDNNLIDENIDVIKAAVAHLIALCEKKGVDLTEALLQNDSKVFKKYPLAAEKIK